jgi:hypothetical protein
MNRFSLLERTKVVSCLVEGNCHGGWNSKPRVSLNEIVNLLD